jgi:hypothetical protein
MNPNATKQLETMKTLTFGVEIETVGASRETLARAIATAFPGSTVNYLGEGYDKWAVTLTDGRRWTVVSDASLTGGRFGQNGEVVTPICTWADMEAVQAAIRAIRTVAHAQVNESCGIHVHIGTPADRWDAAAITRLAKLVYSQEELIFAALGVQAGRRNRYTQAVDEAMIGRLNAQRPASREALATAWYGSAFERDSAQRQHYHQSRYRGLNLHSVFYRGTAEFRYFEATLHAGQVKAYIQLALALAAKALNASGAMARRRPFQAATAKYDFRVFLLRLGLIGPEFKTARLHLMGRLEGSAAWRHGRPTPLPAPVAPQSPETPATPAQDAPPAPLPGNGPGSEPEPTLGQ